MLSGAELFALLSAIGDNAVALLAGGLGVILTVISIFLPGYYRKAGIVLGLLAVFWSPVLAWRDEYRKTKQEFILSIDRFVIAGNSPLAIFITVAIRNVGPSPMSIEKIFLDLTAPNVTLTNQQPSLIKNSVTLLYRDGQEIVRPEDLLFDEIANPIVAGGIIRGKLLFEFPGLTPAQWEESQFTICFYDLRGARWCTSRLAKEAGNDPDFLLYPGERPDALRRN